jgi:hypothetical protein
MNRERQQLKQTQDQLATANQQLAEVARSREELAQLKKQARRSGGRTARFSGSIVQSVLKLAFIDKNDFYRYVC